jgi:ABC-type phosphate transport system substrate-binding protein
LVGVGAASASAVTTQCSGVNIAGQGANVLKIAMQNVWGPDFNTSTTATACSGTQGTGGKPTVTYTSTSSGIGLESWGVAKHAASFAPTNGFVGTEEPPNEVQKGEIEANETTLVPSTVQSIPVAQESIAVIAHLPANCTATSTAFPGRLVLNNVTLQAIFLGTITTWNQITDGGDSISGAGCNAATPITRVVRLDSAGTSHIFKKYLNLVNASPFETESATSQNWNELSEGAGNSVWPKAAAVVRPAKTGDTALVAKVAETAGSIGYAGLSNARANSAFVPPSGGPNTATFWIPVQNNGVGTKKITYVDPSTNGEATVAADANCAKTKYTNGKGTKFPPSSTALEWNEVTTATKQKNFTICGIAYVLSLSKYSAYPATSEGEALTANNFLQFVLSTKEGGGQLLIENHDYEALPKALVKEAVKGAQTLVF